MKNFAYLFSKVFELTEWGDMLIRFLAKADPVVSETQRRNSKTARFERGRII